MMPLCAPTCKYGTMMLSGPWLIPVVRGCPHGDARWFPMGINSSAPFDWLQRRFIKFHCWPLTNLQTAPQHNIRHQFGCLWRHVDIDKVESLHRAEMWTFARLKLSHHIRSCGQGRAPHHAGHRYALANHVHVHTKDDTLCRKCRERFAHSVSLWKTRRSECSFDRNI